MPGRREYWARFSFWSSAVLALYTAYNYFFVSGKVNGVYQPIVALQYSWLQFSPGMSIDMGILLDPASVMMLVVVTFVSLMVHVFSIGYMKGEERVRHLLCISWIVHFFYVGAGTIDEYFSDLYFLGTGRCIIFPAHWVLL